MRNDDLENMFAALSDDAAHARLAPAETLRVRADRQTLTRSVSGVAAVAVLVAGVAVGSRLVLADEALPPSPPGQSIPATTPSTTPSAGPSGPPGGGASRVPVPLSSVTFGSASIPALIPDRAFLRGPDVNGGQPRRLRSGTLVPLTICGPSQFASEKRVGARGGIEVHDQDGRAGFTPRSTVTEMVTIYRDDGAAALLDETRAELRNCSAGADLTYRSLGSLDLGDESILVRGSQRARGDDGELSPGGGTTDFYLARIRVRDAVVELLVTGYEAQSVERARAEALARRAVQRLTGWRG